MRHSVVAVTGGCGFIGSNFVRTLLAADPAVRVVNLDALTYAGNPRTLADLAEHPRYRFLHVDVCDGAALTHALDGTKNPDWGPVGAVVHFAAESHVDRSIAGPAAFVRTNITGTQALLDVQRTGVFSRLVVVSTDEVYGDLGPDDPPFTEAHPLRPSSPYAASKAGADLLTLAYVRTYGVDALITRCSNNYGPYQFPEKLIPLMTLNALAGRPLPVYGDGKNVRDWIHVADHCTGVLAALERGEAGRVYNFGGRSERANIDVVQSVIAAVGADEGLIRFVTDRPGHDRRYAVDDAATRAALGWAPVHDFATGLAATVAWYRDNEAWWRPIVTGEYRAWIDRWYADRGG